jgi:hypothetical protein
VCSSDLRDSDVQLNQLKKMLADNELSEAANVYEMPETIMVKSLSGKGNDHDHERLGMYCQKRSYTQNNTVIGKPLTITISEQNSLSIFKTLLK